MSHSIVGSALFAGPKRAILLTAALVLLDVAPCPRNALADPAPDTGAMLAEFNRICNDLVRAREELRLGSLDEDSFASRVLDLFVAADSLGVLVQSWSPASRRFGGTNFAMDRGLRFLIESLRENYVGIVARNGVSFLAADRALQAAVAWRSGVGTGVATGKVSAAALP
jgi:hypothetical protein